LLVVAAVVVLVGFLSVCGSIRFGRGTVDLTG